MMLPVSGSSNSPFSGLGKAPPLSHRAARWYRFEIDCGAYPSGVSVKSLMREADGQRRRKHSSSAASSGSQKTSVTPAAASKPTTGALDKAASGAGASGGTPSPATAPTQSPSESAPSARDKVDGGGAMPGSATGLDSQKPKVPEEQEPGEHGGGPTGSDEVKKQAAVPVPADVRAEGAAGSGTDDGSAVDVGQETDAEIAVEDGSRAPTKTGSGTSSAAETHTAQSSTSASEVDVAGKGSSSSASSGSGKAGATPAALQAPLDSAVEAPAVRLQDSPPRGRRMNLIEQLELKYGHTVFGLPTSSEEDSYGSEESMLDPDEDSGGDGGNGGGGGGGGGVSGGDDTGVAKSRKRKKPKRKKGLPGDDLDYDDDFIDDSELEKAYYAKEASSKAKTLHSGFFANQGAVETIMTPKASMKARGGTGQGSAGEGKGSGAGGAGAGGNSSGGDGDPAAKKKKKKPKVVSASATGTSGSATTDGGETTPGPAKKKARKSPAEGGNAKKAQKAKSSGVATSTTAVVASTAAAGAAGATSSDAATAAAAATTGSNTGTASVAASDGVPATAETDSNNNNSSNGNSNGAAAKVNQDGAKENNGGDSSGDGAKTGEGICEGGGRGDDGSDEATAKTDGSAAAGVVVVDVGGGTDGGVSAASGSTPVPSEAEPSGANALLSPEKNADSRPTPGSGASGAGQNTVDPDSGGSGGKGAASGGGGAGGGEKNGGKSAARPATMESWDPSLVEAVSRFEEDSKAWVEAGRQEGEGAAHILEGMRTVDALVRQSVPDAHSTRPYLERLSAVCGRPAAEVKGILLGLKDEEDKRESARLHEEFDALRSAFVSKVKETVSQQQESTATTTVATATPPTVAPGAKPPAPPFAWSPALREALHDLLRAFEAWIVKAHGGQRTKQAVIETKAMYDQLVLEWPAEMGMTVEELKKIYLYQKRRIRVRANKEAAAETPTLPANPAAAGAVSEGASLTGGQQPDPGRDQSRKEIPGSALRKDRSTAGAAASSCPNSPDDASPAPSAATPAMSDTSARRLPGSIDNAAWMFPLGTPTSAGAASPGAGMMSKAPASDDGDASESPIFAKGAVSGRVVPSATAQGHFALVMQPPPPRTSSTLTGSTATNPRLPVRGTRFESPPVYEERDFFEVYGDDEIDIDGGSHPGYESLTDNGD